MSVMKQIERPSSLTPSRGFFETNQSTARRFESLPRLWRTVAPSLSGSIALALLTFVCFRLRLDLATTAYLYLIVVVLLSLEGRSLSSAIVSLIAVGCLAYYFAPPIFSVRVSDPRHGVAIVAFLTTSAVIAHLTSRARIRTEQLVLTNAKLEAQIAEREQAEEALRQARADLAHVGRVTTMGELTTSQAHEVNHPIAAAVTNANTCLRWLAADTPNLEEARAAAMRIVKDGMRAAEIISRIRLLFKKGTPQRELVDVNEVIREVIVLLRSEATRYSISVGTELADRPEVMGDRVQSQPVMMNLMINGIDALKGMNAGGELQVAARRGWSTADLGQRYRRGAAPAAGEPDLQCVFYHQGSRDRHGIVHQPLHRRIP